MKNTTLVILFALGLYSVAPVKPPALWKCQGLIGGIFMPRRRENFVAGHYYHLYNRGVNGMSIFESPENYTFLLRRLKGLLLANNHEMIAYCLMPNHYHFLLRQNGDTPVGLTVQYLFNGYVKAFNVQCNRKGALFRGRYQSRRVVDEGDLLHLCRYIHRNPIDAYPPLVSKLEEWPYSNYPEWVERRSGALVSSGFIQTHFESGEQYAAFVHACPAQKVFIRLEKWLYD